MPSSRHANLILHMGVSRPSRVSSFGFLAHRLNLPLPKEGNHQFSISQYPGQLTLQPNLLYPIYPYKPSVCDYAPKVSLEDLITYAMVRALLLSQEVYSVPEITCKP